MIFRVALRASEAGMALSLESIVEVCYESTGLAGERKGR